MADLAADRIQIRHRSSGQVIDIARSALPFWPEYEPIEPPKHPAKSATKADWVAYATENGLSADEADAMTRDQLVEHFIPSSSDQEV